MKHISIASLERFAHIKAHTFRVWEKRYSFLKPFRTDTNQRYYTLHQLSELLNIALLNKAGYKISMLDKLDAFTIKKIVEALRDDDVRKNNEINLLIVSMYAESIDEFEEILDRCVHYWGIDITIEDIIVPFLNLVQLDSYSDTSSEIHFVVTALRKKLIVGIETVKPVVQAEQKSVLFFLPHREHFDLILLYESYVARRAGYKIYYLGTNMPFETLKEVVVRKKPYLIITYLTKINPFPTQNFSRFLMDNCAEASMIITGNTSGCKEFKVPNLQLMEHTELKNHLGKNAYKNQTHFAAITNYYE